MSTKQTGGTWDPSAPPMYFVAMTTMYDDVPALVENVLLPVTNAKAPDAQVMFNSGRRLNILVDSGVFELAAAHARKNNLTHDEALRAPIDEIEGALKLLDSYAEFVSQRGDELWGYVEFDIGGREQKIKTRAKLESAGLRPIPVIHPLNDGWSYFDEMADKYDRLCVGNLVGASESVRRRILFEVQRRRQGKAVKWIHALGVTPSSLWMSLPTESCDSSSFANMTRWGGEARDYAAFAQVPVGIKQITTKGMIMYKIEVAIGGALGSATTAARQEIG